MKIKIRTVGSVIAGLTALFIGSNLMAGIVDLENRLPAWADGLEGRAYTGSAVGFEGIDIEYRNGRTKKGVTADSTFFGVANNTSKFYLNPPSNGDDRTYFDGDIIIDADISSRGKLRDGSTFGIYAPVNAANTDLFGANPAVEYGCNKQGKACSEGMLVLGGDLNGFGWSGSMGILEFLISHLSGWAKDMWAPSLGATNLDHLFLDVGAFTLNNVSSVKSFSATADGYAVVPVPAAAWLFGSGLLGLIGFAKRKRA